MKLQSIPAALVSMLLMAGACTGGGDAARTASQPVEGEKPRNPTADPAVKPDPEPAPDGSASDAKSVQLDGIRLGTSLATLMDRAPYDKPCDLDALPQLARSAVVYAGKPCHEQTFPEGTTVLFLLTYAEGDSATQLAQPIEAMAWLGGTYFDARSNLPVKIGAKQPELDAALGAPAVSFQIGTEFETVTDTPDPKPVGDPLLAHHHGKDLWSLTRSGVAVGFVVGPMPQDAENEQWRSISRLFFHYAT